MAGCGLWLGEEGPDRRGDDFGLAAAVDRADVGGATVIKAAEYCTPVVREGAGEGVEAGPDEGRSFHVPGCQQDVGGHVAEMAGTIATFADVRADVLLAGGDMNRPAFIRPGFDALAGILPHNRCAVFRGLDHGGSADVGPANRGGKPEIVAPPIRSFFAQP